MTFATAPLAGALTFDLDDAPTERYIVAFHDDPGLAEGDAYEGAEVVGLIPQLTMAVVAVSDFETFRLRAMLDENVRYVEYDNPTAAFANFVPNDALYNHAAHWGPQRIGAPTAWDTTLGSTAVKVGHIDSGLLKNHEEFAGSGRVLQGWDFINNDNDPNDESGCSWHGSHTTSTHAATINNGLGIAGLAQSTILPVKAFYKWAIYCTSSTTALVGALTYVADQGSHVSSNSWGGGASSAENDAIDYAFSKGVILVAAAGNDGPCSNCVGYPWKDRPDKTIIVGATDSADGMASFSNTGPEIDVVAPGVYIAGAGDGGYYALDGTSMAAPHVTGAIALYLAANPGASYAAVDAQLKATAENLGHSANEQGAGLVRMDLMMGGTPPPPTYQCSDGLDNDGDGLVDYPADPGCASSTDDDEYNAPTGGSDMHVHDIAHSSSGGKPSKRTLYIDVDIADAAEGGVSAANVCVTVTRSTGGSANGCADTDGTGHVSLQWSQAGVGTYTTCVTSVTKTSWTWDSAADHASSGSCHTSTI